MKLTPFIFDEIRTHLDLVSKQYTTTFLNMGAVVLEQTSTAVINGPPITADKLTTDMSLRFHYPAVTYVKSK